MKIILWPSPVLKQVSAAVVEAPDKEFLAALVDTMKAHHGMGLSAIQVGVAQRIFVVQTGTVPWVFINPVIEEFSREGERVDEGCLSLPGFYEKVWRSASVVVTYQDENMVTQARKEFYGVTAQVIQHEIQHLDGKIYVDKLTKAQKQGIMGKIKALKKAGKWK